MSMLKLGIDLDGCLANFNETFAEVLRAHGQDVPFNFVPPTWDWPQKTLGISDQIVNHVWDEIDKDPTFWGTLAPLKDAPEAIARLHDLTLDGHEVYFMTLRRGIAAKRQSEIWLREFGMEHPTVIMTPSGKARLAYDLGLTHVIDDFPRLLQDYCMHASALKPYAQIYMVDHAYNTECQAWPLTPVASVNEFLDLVVEPEGALV